MKPSDRKKFLKESAKQLKAKLRLEKKLTSKMERFLNRQNMTAVQYRKKFGFLFSAGVGEDELIEILSKHYSRVAGLFKKHVIDDVNRALRSRGMETIERNNHEVNAAIALFISQSAKSGAENIVSRSNRDIAKAFADGAKSEDAANKLNKYKRSRARAIAVEHTQRAAEGSKSEISVAAGRVVSGSLFVAALQIIQKKTWLTRIDMFVRTAHSYALFQTVLATLPFIVMGENLMYPGDMSMGATIGNVANCRCTVIYQTTIVDT